MTKVSKLTSAPPARSSSSLSSSSTPSCTSTMTSAPSSSAHTSSSSASSSSIVPKPMYESKCFFSALWAEPSTSFKPSKALSSRLAKTSKSVSPTPEKPSLISRSPPAKYRPSIASWAAKRRNTFQPSRSSFTRYATAPAPPPAPRAPSASSLQPLPSPSGFKIPKLSSDMLPTQFIPDFSSALLRSPYAAEVLKPSFSSSSRPSHSSSRPSTSSAPIKRPASPLPKSAKRPKLTSAPATASASPPDSPSSSTRPKCSSYGPSHSSFHSSSRPRRCSSPPARKVSKCPPPPPNSPDLGLSKLPFSFTLGIFLTIPKFPKAPAAPREPAVPPSSQD